MIKGRRISASLFGRSAFEINLLSWITFLSLKYFIYYTSTRVRLHSSNYLHFHRVLGKLDISRSSRQNLSPVIPPLPRSSLPSTTVRTFGTLLFARVSFLKTCEVDYKQELFLKQNLDIAEDRGWRF